MFDQLWNKWCRLEKEGSNSERLVGDEKSIVLFVFLLKKLHRQERLYDYYSVWDSRVWRKFVRLGTLYAHIKLESPIPIRKIMTKWVTNGYLKSGWYGYLFGVIIILLYSRTSLPEKVIKGIGFSPNFPKHKWPETSRDLLLQQITTRAVAT